jgi:hypothetical protein
VRVLYDDSANLRRRQLDAVNEYEQRRSSSLTSVAYQQANDAMNLYLPLSRSIAESVQAEICGRGRPKPQFITNGADWRTQRRAKRIDKAVLGVLAMQQGRYADSWELVSDAQLDSVVSGIGYVKPYVRNEQIAIDRVYPWEVFVDPIDARYGYPRSMYHRFALDREVALNEFCDCEGVDKERAVRMRSALDAAKPLLDDDRTTRDSNLIEVVEAWHLPISDTKPGLHVFAVDGCELFSEDWEYDSFPLIPIRWASDRVGFGTCGVISELRPVQEELHVATKRLQESITLRSGRTTFYRAGSLVNERDLVSNETEKFVQITPGGDMPVTPPAQPFSPQDLEYIQWLQSTAYKLSGVSEMSATGRKEAGVTSGEAIRTMMDLSSKRLSQKARAYEMAFVELGRWIARLAASIPGYSARFESRRGAFSEIPWTEAQLREDQYVVRVAPASALPKEPGGNMATIEGMYSAGLVTPQTMRRLLDWPDLDTELSREDAEYEYLASLIERFLDADPDNPQEAWEAPEGFLAGIDGALVQFGAAYFCAKRDGCPDGNLDLLRRYIEELQELADRLAAKAAQKMQAAQERATAGLTGQAGPPGMRQPAGMGAAPPIAPPGPGGIPS